MTDYKNLCAELSAITEDVPHVISNLANASALLYSSLDGVNWAGFYILDQEKLILGPFQGKPACIEIEIGHGVCGRAAAEKHTVVVPDVHRFAGHIACDSASNSEIVIPLMVDGELFGVMDIDSTRFDRFSESDRLGLEEFALILTQQIKRTKG